MHKFCYPGASRTANHSNILCGKMRGTKVQLYQGGWRQYLCTKYAVLTTLNLASLHFKLGKIVATSHYTPFPMSNETAFMHKRPNRICLFQF